MKLLFFRVHFINQTFKFTFSNMPLEFHCAGKYSQCSKRNRRKPHFFCQLESNETLFFTMLSHFLQNKLLKSLISDKNFYCCFSNPQTLCQHKKNIRIDMNNSDIVILKWVSVQETFSHNRTFQVNVFNFLRGNIFALTELVNIFLTVDNFQSTIW